MKNVRIFLASFVLLAIASAFTPKSHVNPVTTPMKFQTCVDEELIWTGNHINSSGADFVLGTTTPTTELKQSGNYASAFQNFGLQSCSGSTKICKIRVRYCYDETQQADPLPTITEVITQVFNNYSSTSPYFPQVGGVSEFTFTKNGITITIDVIYKS